MIFPGSWIASGRPHDPSRQESYLAKPLRRAVLDQQRPHRHDTSSPNTPPVTTVKGTASPQRDIGR